MAILIDGKLLAEKLRAQTARDVAALKAKGITPGLAVVLIGQDAASKIYVQNKQKACEAAGIRNILKVFPKNTDEKKILKTLEELNQDPGVHGILVQLPLPAPLHAKTILAAIHPSKDVDGLHPENMGRLLLKLPGLKPCTPQAVLQMIESTGITIGGKTACVVGRSDIVGKPTALLLMEKDATVTICHSKTPDLAGKVAEADIVVAAAGQPGLIQGDWIKKGAVVIDVGIHRLPGGQICGDVDFKSVSKRAAFLSPVPGGVGPMTIAMLLKNSVQACKGIL